MLNRLTNILTGVVRVGIISILMTLMPMSVHAQDNPYKIDNECYQYYQQVQDNKDSSHSLYLMDKMKDCAIKKDDKKAEIISYVLKTQYYFEKKEDSRFARSISELKDISLKSGLTQYYYYAYAEEVEYLLARRMLISAVDTAIEMQNDSKKRGNDFGGWMSSKTLAKIYVYRKDINNAKKFFKDAIEYSAKIPNQSSTSIYVDLAELYDNPDSSLFYLNQGLKAMNTPSDSLSLFKSLAFAYADAGDFGNYNKYKESFNDLHNAYKTNRSEDDIHKFAYYDCIEKNNYNSALEQISKIKSEEESLKLYQHISILRGDYKSAFNYSNKLNELRDIEMSDISKDEIVEVDDSLNKDFIRSMNDDINRSSETDKMKQKNSFYTILFASIFVILFVIADFTLVYIKEKDDALAKEILLSENLKASKEEADRAREEAIKANNMKTTFVQNMSHEIRTPLNAIVGFSQLMCLPDGYVTEEERQQYGAYITSNSNLLMMLIDDILNIGDVEKGDYKLEIKDSYCNEICKQAMNSVEYRVPSGVNMYFTTDVPDDMMIETDERRVRQVIINLLTNACKHTESGEIHVHCSDKEVENMLTYSVTDTGTGVPADKAEKIFERFTKLDSFKQGAGLGLNICKIISEKLGGVIKLDTTYNNGARFIFAIPYKQPKSLGGLDLSCEKLSDMVQVHKTI